MGSYFRVDPKIDLEKAGMIAYICRGMCFMSIAKSARLEVRMSPHVADLIKRAAEIKGLSKTGFITSVLQKEAEQIIKEKEVLHLSLTDQERFAEAVLNPPLPTPALRKALQRRRELLGAD